MEGGGVGRGGENSKTVSCLVKKKTRLFRSTALPF